MQKLSFALGVLVLPFVFSSLQAQIAEARIRTATISGRVVLKGEPARNALVYLHPIGSPAPSNPDNILRARTDEEGQFRITGVAAGAYYVIPLAPGFVYSAGDEPGPRGKMINVSEGENVENIDIEPYRGGVITGRVIDSQRRPLVGARVTLGRLDKDGRPRFTSSYGSSLEMYETDDRGVYRLYGLPIGRYLVSIGFTPSDAVVPGSGSGTFYPRTFHPNAANESEAKAIEVTEGSESAGVDITVPEPARGRAISGRVINADTGQPVEGIEIAYNAVSGSDRFINYWRSNDKRSGANGEFGLKDLEPGKYEIAARPGSENEFFSKPVVCDLSDGDVKGVEVKVHRGGSLSGGVVIEGMDDPKALAKLTKLFIYVRVLPYQSGPLRRDNPKINADGSFQVRGLPRGWAWIEGLMNVEGGDFSLARIEHNGAVVRDGIEVDPGKHVTGVRVVLAYNGQR